MADREDGERDPGEKVRRTGNLVLNYKEGEAAKIGDACFTVGEIQWDYVVLYVPEPVVLQALERVQVGEGQVTFVGTDRSQVKIGIRAPVDVPIVREAAVRQDAKVRS